MKHLAIILAATMTLIAMPLHAQSFDLGSLTPTLVFPEPVQGTVSKDVADFDK